MTTQEFLKIIQNMIDKKVKLAFTLGTIDPNYLSGNPKIMFDGETVASAKRYPHLSSYNPVKNDRVIMANVGGSHVVLGSIGSFRGTSGGSGGGTSTGVGLDFIWSGTQLGVKKATDTEYIFAELKGDKGDKGDTGEGIQGIQGIKGDKGDKGDTGEGIQGIQGIKGDKGDKGDTGSSLYTWVKYGTTSTGGTLSDLPTGKDYIGFAFNKTTPTPSNIATDYKWSLIRGEQGIQGIQGVKGDAGDSLATSRETAWVQPSTYGSGWINYGGGYDHLKYRRSVNNTVMLKGMIKQGTTGLLFTLPAGFRPPFTIMVFAHCRGLNANPQPVELRIATTGTVTIMNMPDNNWMSLEGLSFALDS